MASNVSISVAASNAAVDALCALLDEGGTLDIWSGTIPADCAAADAPDGTELASMGFHSTAFLAAGATDPRRAYADTITPDATSAGGGDATHFRCKDAMSAVVIQGTAGNAGDTPDLVFDNKAIGPGAQTGCSEFWIEVPGSAA